VPDAAVATEEYAAVSLYRCSTVEAILDHPRFPVRPPLHKIPHPHMLCWLGFCLTKALHQQPAIASLDLVSLPILLSTAGIETPIAPPLSDRTPPPLPATNALCKAALSANEKRLGGAEILHCGR
jgi:hypothetical protein